MTLRSVSRTSAVLALCLLLAVPAFPQTDLSGIGPSKGQIAAAIVGAVAVIIGVVVLVYYGTHKHASIVGCVASGPSGLSVRNDKDKKTYALAGDSAALRPGQQVALKGKKGKDATGKPTFLVQQLTKDYGDCQP